LGMCMLSFHVNGEGVACSSISHFSSFLHQ
jgi:hypothetical protein